MLTSVRQGLHAAVDEICNSEAALWREAVASQLTHNYSIDIIPEESNSLLASRLGSETAPHDDWRRLLDDGTYSDDERSAQARALYELSKLHLRDTTGDHTNMIASDNASSRVYARNAESRPNSDDARSECSDLEVDLYNVKYLDRSSLSHKSSERKGRACVDVRTKRKAHNVKSFKAGYGTCRANNHSMSKNTMTSNSASPLKFAAVQRKNSKSDFSQQLFAQKKRCASKDAFDERALCSNKTPIKLANYSRNVGQMGKNRSPLKKLIATDLCSTMGRASKRASKKALGVVAKSGFGIKEVWRLTKR